jgi:hypothetical protein
MNPINPDKFPATLWCLYLDGNSLVVDRLADRLVNPLDWPDLNLAQAYVDAIRENLALVPAAGLVSL